MIISKLIEQLQEIKDREGDIEVTTTGSLIPDGQDAAGNDNANIPLAFESTVETLIVQKPGGNFDKKRVRLYWQC